jgi:hypothetical protein
MQRAGQIPIWLGDGIARVSRFRVFLLSGFHDLPTVGFRALALNGKPTLALSEGCRGVQTEAFAVMLPLTEDQMYGTVDVTIPVEPEAAAALVDARNREAVGRLVSRVLRPRSGPSPLAQAIAELKAEATAAGLSDADIDAELATYNAERRDHSGD